VTTITESGKGRKLFYPHEGWRTVRQAIQSNAGTVRLCILIATPQLVALCGLALLAR
jgi:hypothetical protein